MIKNITGMNGIIASGQSSYYPTITGSIRWNGQSQCLEIMDGMNWQQIQPSYATIELDTNTQITLKWAQEQMKKEIDIKALCEKHPGLQEVKDKYELFLALCKDYDEKETT